MSKRVLHHPEVPEMEADQSVWRSVREHEDTIKFRHQAIREFSDSEDVMDEDEREFSRRNFVKLMGASTALAGLGLASCRRPEAYILPYTEGPEWVVPGRPLYYATNMPSAAGAIPLVVTTHESRPTRLAPNKKHPDNTGTDAQVQASILNLYSTSRSQQFLQDGSQVTKAEFDAFFAKFAKAPGKLGVVFGVDESPTRNRLAKEITKKFPGAKIYNYEALENVSAETAIAKAFGANKVKLTPKLEKADRIFSLDSDFIELDAQSSTIQYSKKRQGGGENYDQEVDKKVMSRHYQVESIFSLTGGMADHRLRVAPSQVSKVGVAVAKEVQALAPNANLAKALGDLTADFAVDPKFAKDESEEGKKAYKEEKEYVKSLKEWVKECAKDLVSKKGKSVVLVGPNQPEELHVLGLALNDALGAFGKTINAYASKSAATGSLIDLKKDVDAGTVDSLLLLTPSNPLFDAAADVDFASILEKVNVSIHSGERTDKTAYACDWHIPATHYLESWGDSLTANGFYSVVQPMILPLSENTFSEVDVLTALLSGEALATPTAQEPSAGYHQVKATFDKKFAQSAADWNELLKNGFSKRRGYASAQLKSVPSADKLANKYAKAPSKDALEVILAKDHSINDGRYIDNAWLQESPDPVVKLTWDNAAIVSPKTAKELGVYDTIVKLETWNAGRPEIGEAGQARAPIAKITVGDTSVEVPVLIGFGQADYTITLPVGYGQARDDEYQSADRFDEAKPVVGHVGKNTGFNVYPLRKESSQFLLAGAKVAETKGEYPVASTQEHHAMYGRALAREISTMESPAKGDYKKQLKKVDQQGMDSHIPENIPLYKANDKEGNKLIGDPIHQWGMTIDLNTCTGCNACLIACQAENNIPVVGKEQVAKGREMHWIRMDRYYASQNYEYDSHGHKAKDENGDKVKTPKWISENPAMLPQPVACTQCESAPCETVCPVNATVHTEEGLNAMAYNRCIGTRYCANNCPFKARRFNFFDYNKRNPLIKKNLYKGPFGEKKEGSPESLQRNPNVSVRMRGVMEKCTYCVQALELAKIKQKQITKKKAEAAGFSLSPAAKVETSDLMIARDSVQVACQSACPSDAVSFGNLLRDGEQTKDKDRVVKAKASKRNYELLKYVGTFSRTTYLARVKNPNPEMPDAKYIGLASINIH